ncbi:MAG: hypothetical protein HY304_03890 [candidate division Zixibacteria bacterium]|nr:hypothetical protein [candidate division Zixibacteria bacterium]
MMNRHGKVGQSFWVGVAAAVALGLVAGATSAFAQTGLSVANPARGGFAGATRASDLTGSQLGRGWALLDPSRLHMRQSYSLSYFSGSAGSGSVGLYMNTLEYDLFKPLTVRVGLGYMHNPLGSLVKSGGGGQALVENRFLPNFSLDFHPSDKFQLMVDFRTVPYDGLGYYGSRSRYGFMSPWGW